MSITFGTFAFFAFPSLNLNVNKVTTSKIINLKWLVQVNGCFLYSKCVVVCPLLFCLFVFICSSPKWRSLLAFAPDNAEVLALSCFELGALRVVETPQRIHLRNLKADSTSTPEVMSATQASPNFFFALFLCVVFNAARIPNSCSSECSTRCRLIFGVFTNFQISSSVCKIYSDDKNTLRKCLSMYTNINSILTK